MLSIKEYTSEYFSKDVLSRDEEEFLWHNYRNKISLEDPSFKNNHQWVIKSNGWIGQIPLDENKAIYIEPRVELQNLFGMWEYAYRLKSFHFLDGIVGCDTLMEFYSQLAKILALSVLDRARKGFFRNYREKYEKLPYVKGRIDLRSLYSRSSEVGLYCDYKEQTGDNEDNQIIAWTLRQIARSGLCSKSVTPIVRKAFHSLQGLVTLSPFDSNDCRDRDYHRLNIDYKSLHVLCAFFLDNSGPTHNLGSKKTIPFLVNMPRLYEMFVAEWLRENLSNNWRVSPQESIPIGTNGEFKWVADIVLYDNKQDRSVFIMDTKYKIDPKPGSNDMAQIIANANAIDCKEAILIYPIPLEVPINTVSNQIKVRSLCFGLDGDLETNGQCFLKDLNGE
jgi:5-methylcytosine-specific restriction enzyme subunit McrC